MLSRSVEENLSLRPAPGMSLLGLERPAARTRLAAEWMERLGIRASSPGQAVGELSGGNQQKAALGRLLSQELDVLLLDEPTRGIDVGSKQQIYRLVGELAAGGKAVLLVSSYLPELLGLSDRVAVMHRGKLGPFRPAGELTEAAVLLEASGRMNPRQAFRAPWAGPLVALFVVYGLFAVLSPQTFASPANLVTMARQTVVVGLSAVGMTLVIILGGIDLSVGSLVALSTVTLALLLRSGAGPVAASLGAVAVGAASGASVGALVTGLRVTPFIVTLGAMSVLRGAAKGLAGEQKIDVDPAGIDTLLAVLPPGRRFLLLPPGVWVLLLTAGLAAFLLSRTRLGRHVVAVGSNERTALLCGVAVGRTKLIVYALSGALTGLAGVMEFSTLTVGDPTDSVGLELEVIASVVIGGGSLSGGEGSIGGSLLGALLMTVIRTGCTHLGVPNWVQEIVTGLIIVVAVGIDRLRHRRS